MQKFYYFLIDMPNYPNEIMATTKDDVKKLLLQSIPEESNILKILSEEEFTGKKAKKVDLDGEMLDDGPDMDKLTAQLMQQDHTPKPAPASTPVVEAPAPPPEVSAPKFFEEAGIKFKLENGKLYKNAWVPVTSDNFRIKVVSTDKVVPMDKYKIEQLDWVEISE